MIELHLTPSEAANLHAVMTSIAEQKISISNQNALDFNTNKTQRAYDFVIKKAKEKLDEVHGGSFSPETWANVFHLVSEELKEQETYEFMQINLENEPNVKVGKTEYNCIKQLLA